MLGRTSLLSKTNLVNDSIMPVVAAGCAMESLHDISICIRGIDSYLNVCRGYFVICDHTFAYFLENRRLDHY